MDVLTRRKLIDDPRVSSQQALVKQLIPKQVKALRRTIPGGKQLIEQIDQQNMEQTVYNWLRGCGHFTEVKISLAKDPDKIATEPQRRATWDSRGGTLFWEKSQNKITGRRELARLIANIINKEQFVYIQAKPDGLFVAKDKTGKFGPTVELTKKLQEENPGLAELPLKTKVPNPDWEPFVEFLPKRGKMIL